MSDSRSRVEDGADCPCHLLDVEIVEASPAVSAGGLNHWNTTGLFRTLDGVRMDGLDVAIEAVSCQATRAGLQPRASHDQTRIRTAESRGLAALVRDEVDELAADERCAVLNDDGMDPGNLKTYEVTGKERAERFAGDGRRAARDDHMLPPEHRQAVQRAQHGAEHAHSIGSVSRGAR